MFSAVAHVPPVAYIDPWLMPLERRLADLASGSRRIAYYYDMPDNSTFRYRVYNMIQALRADPASDISASYFSRTELDRMDSFIERADVLVLCRVRYSAAINRLVTRARARGLKVLFDVDDLVFDPEYVHLLVDTLALDQTSEAVWIDWFGYIGRQNASMRLCDGGITTNRFLAERLAHAGGGFPVAVVPNFINREQLALSERVHEAKKNSGFARDGRIHLGYFSGSPSHNRDFALIADVVARAMDRDSRLVLRLVGFIDGTGPLQRHRGRVEVLPFHDFVNLQALVGATEINMVPLQDNVFTNCKSELKYFEAGIVGTLTVATPIYSYRTTIRDGENGFLARAQDWDQKLAAAIAAVDDRLRYQEMVERAFVDSDGRYLWLRQAGQIEAAIFGDVQHPIPMRPRFPPIESPYG